MKLTVFQSDKGDCLMLNSGAKRMLIDGGMRHSYTQHAAPTFDRLRKNGEKLDLVYVSHIDRDHVFGVLQMMEDLVAWRVYDFHQNAPGGNRDFPKPKVRRPPEIGGIWHNSFHEIAGRNAGALGDMLAASAYALSGFDDTEIADLSGTYQNLASSMADAVELSRRVGTDQLNLPINKEFGGKLILRRTDQQPVRFGKSKIYVIGPAKSDLQKLRRQWNKWLKSAKGGKQIERIRRRHRRDEEILEQADLAELLGLRRARAEELGKRTKVTQPNLASLMLFIDESRKTILLTGDGHWEDILAGLEEAQKITPQGGLHVNALKVQHHGSEHNIDTPFCKRITADHYIFCGNGAHENPDLRVIDIIANSRIGTVSQRSSNAERGNTCTFWFNSSSKISGGKVKDLEHMKKIEERMKGIERRSNGKIKSRFLKSSKFEITI
jgi:beta-lactamase superfamily II metal-dependent hydrolase